MQYKFRHILVFLVLLSFIAGCSGLGPVKSITTAINGREQDDKTREKNNSAIIMGTVTNNGRLRQPMLVIAYSLNLSADNQEKLYSYVILEESGSYMLYLPGGDYHIYTLMDFNDNNTFDRNEVSGTFKKRKKVSIRTGELLTQVDMISASSPMDEVEFPGETGITYDYQSLEYRWKNGQVVKIYDEIFSPQNATIGLWTPSNFMKTFGANIFLMEEYDESLQI